MLKPIAPAQGIAFAFPDICKTPTPAGDVPIPYPNIAQLNLANKKTNKPGKELKVKGQHVLLKNAEISTSVGNEAGVSGGIKSNRIKGKCQITQASTTVVYGPDKLGLVRFMDSTIQNYGSAVNDGNAVGIVLSANPTVLVGE
jgi:hypothetical protein